MKKSINKIKKSDIIGIVIILFSICFCVFSFRFEILKVINNFNKEEITSLNLTTEQKLEDFEIFYNTVSENMMSLDDYAELLSVDFLDRYDFYVEQIKNTENDYEFYCVMYAISADIPSFHTDMLYPTMNAYKSTNCFNTTEFLATKNLENYTEYWGDLLNDTTADFDDNMKVAMFKYTDGKYVSSYSESELLSINGIEVDEYITSDLSIFSRDYDFEHKKPYRTMIFLNDTDGIPARVELKNKDAEIELHNLYSNVNYEIHWKSLMPEFDGTYEEDLFYEDSDYLYLNIENCSYSQGEKYEEILKNSDKENIILDLRTNYGGHQKFMGDFIYPYIFAEDITIKNNWYIKDTEDNKQFFSKLINHLIVNFKSTEDKDVLYSDEKNYLYSTIKYVYKGRLDKNKNVYLLTSRSTGSAADRFVATVKDYNLGTVIGANTGGEGLMDSFLIKDLPNSKLAFIYMPSKALNADGTDNSAYGTSPDIYISQTVESRYLLDDFYYKYENPYTFENRLLWDNVLMETIELINGKERLDR